MKALFVSLALVCSAAGSSSKAALGQPSGKEPRPKIGTITIIGNDVTRDDVILPALRGLFPGQDLRDADLRTAEKNLERLGLFAVDPVKGTRPTVTVAEGDGEFRDVIVNVQEKATWNVRLMLGLNSKGKAVASVVWEERNFDPNRPPISSDDLFAGGAFRGAGQSFRLELLQVPVMPLRSMCFFQTGSFLLPVGDFGLFARSDKTGG